MFQSTSQLKTPAASKSATPPLTHLNAPAVAPMSQNHRVPLQAQPLTTVPTHADVAQRAYDIYVNSGYHQGQCQQNWQQAERDLNSKGTMACHAEHLSKEVFAPDAIATE